MISYLKPHYWFFCSIQETRHVTHYTPQTLTSICVVHASRFVLLRTFQPCAEPAARLGPDRHPEPISLDPDPDPDSGLPPLVSINTLLVDMTGAEIFVAVVAILAGFATCSQFATQVIEKIKQNRTFGRVVTQAERLGYSLGGGQSAIEHELDNLRRLNGTIGLGAGMYLGSAITRKVAHSI